MAIATHLIKIKGTFDTEKWTEKQIKRYIDKKIIEEIDPSFHADLELFQIKDNNIKIWVYVSALPSEVTKDIIEKWLKDHIREEGIRVKDFEIEKIMDFANPKNFFIRI